MISEKWNLHIAELDLDQHIYMVPTAQILFFEKGWIYALQCWYKIKYR